MEAGNDDPPAERPVPKSSLLPGFRVSGRSDYRELGVKGPHAIERRAGRCSPREGVGGRPIAQNHDVATSRDGCQIIWLTHQQLLAMLG